MSELSVRKMVYSVEEIFHEGGPRPSHALVRVFAMAIIQNPFAGCYVEKIQWFMEDLKPLGLKMAKKLISFLGGS
tara:strand:+ start:75 stop:299 length:225 start_codon:yes stop_codon:yes gene_type:complete